MPPSSLTNHRGDVITEKIFPEIDGETNHFDRTKKSDFILYTFTLLHAALLCIRFFSHFTASYLQLHTTHGFVFLLHFVSNSSRIASASKPVLVRTASRSWVWCELVPGPAMSTLPTTPVGKQQLIDMKAGAILRGHARWGRLSDIGLSTF